MLWNVDNVAHLEKHSKTNPKFCARKKVSEAQTAAATAALVGKEAQLALAHDLLSFEFGRLPTLRSKIAQADGFEEF